MKYFVYWTEDRRDNEKKPSIWNCIITSNATDDDIESFKEYGDFISEITEHKIAVGWIENENSDSVDQFVRDQNFYNDIVDENVDNVFSKYEYDRTGLETLKLEMHNLIEFYNSLSNNKKENFKQNILSNLNNNFYNKNKSFIQFKDMRLFIEAAKQEEQNAKQSRRKKRQDQEQEIE